MINKKTILQFFSIFILFSNDSHANANLVTPEYSRCLHAADKLYLSQDVPRQDYEDHDVPENIATLIAQIDYRNGSFNGESWRKIDPANFYIARFVDLNADGTPELLIQAIQYEEDGHIVRYASMHNDYTWIYEINNNIPRLLLTDSQGGSFNGGYPIQLEERTNNYMNICTIQHVAAHNFIIKIFKYNGIQYVPSKCNEEVYGDSITSTIALKSLDCKSLSR